MSGFRPDERDRRQLAERGISLAEIERQLALFRRPDFALRLDRPCVPGDGIERIDPGEVAELHALHEEAVSAGRWSKFVPASGAATRMFRELLRFQRGDDRGVGWNEVRRRAGAGDDAAGALVRFVESLSRFAFHGELRSALAARGHELEDLAESGSYAPILDALLSADGMDYERLPKGLIRFHAEGSGGRTPLEEHLVEAAHYARRGSECVVHFTVSPEHREGFARRFESVRATYEARFGVRYVLQTSVQKPSTDTIAVGRENEPIRDADGRLVFRPGGHGALIENLGELDADLVYVKNIDNVQPDRLKPTAMAWKKTLGGLLVRLERRIAEHLRRLKGGESPLEAIERATTFAGRHLSAALNGRADPVSPERRRDALIRLLERPLRVCGVVPNTGEPGGGPFWVRDEDGGVSRQIVETAQIDLDDREQAAILAGATHFNPVDLVCALRSPDGRPYALDRFVDPSAVIVTEKSAGGRDLRALERPGLWNGAMARWNTIFVEVPLETFSPVKSVLDLLRDEHR